MGDLVTRHEAKVGKKQENRKGLVPQSCKPDFTLWGWGLPKGLKHGCDVVSSDFYIVPLAFLMCPLVSTSCDSKATCDYCGEL